MRGSMQHSPKALQPNNWGETKKQRKGLGHLHIPPRDLAKQPLCNSSANPEGKKNTKKKRNLVALLPPSIYKKESKRKPSKQKGHGGCAPNGVTPHTLSFIRRGKRKEEQMYTVTAHFLTQTWVDSGTLLLRHGEIAARPKRSG